MSEPQRIHSRDNPLLKRLRSLSQDNTAYRRLGQFWIEGDHLCTALLARGGRPVQAVFSESAWERADMVLKRACERVVVVPDRLLAATSGLESASSLGFLVDLPAAAGPLQGAPTLVLDRLQDAGNVGSLLRSAAAFGFRQVLAIRGTAALWSPKVLRAAMGAHFALQLCELLEPFDLKHLEVPLLVTSSHRGQWLHESVLPWPCAWVLGHEGQGVGSELEAMAGQSVRIAQPGGEESLNVAAAGAICLHASAVSARLATG
ncbi:MAG TPA: RNA methyltransferase [Hydrogenophaga sp.]|uniref:TrmH family RNA methyltransferase n=1 Tax=Hydrogenophaga sp. TaxID=1904254 RepID=UPI002B64D2D4|nr:RNA methyltransferase [Hydrogenophaga sp.]HMN91895.1 RNA methyltransferase [Hydrogenophaga sp.]HMP08965.1 RNA methyltransferase [Hydrogenophaga sp.]